MVTELALLKIKNGESAAFENAFEKAKEIISKSPGYIEHEFQKCLEEENKYLFIVRWETQEDHTEGFRKSEPYLEWKKLLHHFYDPFPTVEHYKKLD